jgi:hypothetical protein
MRGDSAHHQSPGNLMDRVELSAERSPLVHILDGYLIHLYLLLLEHQVIIVLPDDPEIRIMMLFLRIARISMTPEITADYRFVTVFVNVSGVSIALVPLCVQSSRPSVVVVGYSPALSLSTSILPAATMEATSSP